MRSETRRLILRDYEESDKTAYFKLKSDSKTMYYLQDIQLFSQEESDIDFAFLENNVYRITTGCLSENVGSERVMQKCGLIKEAEHVDWEWHEGKMKTRLEYRLLRNEWNQLQNL